MARAILPWLLVGLGSGCSVVLDTGGYTLEFDMTGFRSRGGSSGRVVYGRDGVYYGLEVSQAMAIVAP
jgi:hypothetical protein